MAQFKWLKEAYVTHAPLYFICILMEDAGVLDNHLNWSCLCWLWLSVFRFSWSRRSVCAHSLRRLGREGPSLKVAMQMSNLRVNRHFLWPASGVCLLGCWAKLSLSSFWLSEWSKRKSGVRCWISARTLTYPRCRRQILTTCLRGMRPSTH